MVLTLDGRPIRHTIPRQGPASLQPFHNEFFVRIVEERLVSFREQALSALIAIEVDTSYFLDI